ncbi:MAG: SH3 domain-containing protein [Anaerolineae bacterium]|nr:SH3 domain-containing protein [Anaerolineae bacterium]
MGILVLIAALWFLVIAPAGSPPPSITVTPMSTATPWPTVTPMVISQPTQALAPEVTPTVAQPGTVAVGARVVVAGTGVAQLRVRQAPGVDTVTVKVVPDGTQFVVIGGPEQASGYTWWKVEDQAGTVGWVAGNYLTLAP